VIITSNNHHRRLLPTELLRSSNQKHTRPPIGAFALIQSTLCGWHMLSVFESVGPLTSLFSRSSHRNRSRALIAVQPSFSTVRCKTLNIFIKVCYSLPCLLHSILARLPSSRIEDSDQVGNGCLLSQPSLPFFSVLRSPLFSSLTTVHFSSKPLYFQTSTDTPAQRARLNSFGISTFRTLFIATEGGPPTLPNLELIPLAFAPISRRRSPFPSTTYSIPFPQLLDFKHFPF
jgi:hypothetical protein